MVRLKEKSRKIESLFGIYFTVLAVLAGIFYGFSSAIFTEVVKAVIADKPLHWFLLLGLIIIGVVTVFLAKTLKIVLNLLNDLLIPKKSSKT